MKNTLSREHHLASKGNL